MEVREHWVSGNRGYRWLVVSGRGWVLGTELVLYKNSGFLLSGLMTQPSLLSPPPMWLYNLLKLLDHPHLW